MECSCCGRKITKVYIWQGKPYGSKCIKALNPWYTNPAATLRLVAAHIIDGDKSLLPLIPPTWRTMFTSYTIKDTREHALTSGTPHDLMLACRVYNKVARTGQKVFKFEELVGGNR